MNDGTLAMDQGAVEAEASTISNAKQCLQASALSSTDGESTISANENGKNAFEKAQSGLEALGGAVDQEVSNIHSLGLAFEEFDNMIAEANRQ